MAVFTGCGGSATTSVSGPSITKCDVSVTNSAAEIPASGGSGSLLLTTERECAWSSSSKDPWISLNTTSGQGAATIGYTVLANPNGARRQGHVLVSNQTVEVNQAAAACQYSLAPSAADAPAAQAEVSVALTATPSCSWNAHSNAEWIGPPVPGSGVGSATVRMMIATNTSPARIGTVTFGDTTLRVNQAGADGAVPTPPSPGPTPAPTPTPPGPNPTPPAPNPTPPACSYGVSPIRIPIDAAGGQRSITVTTSSGCAWNAASVVNWIAVASGSQGSGNGSVTINIDPNTGSARTATLTVASQSIAVEQGAQPSAPCTYAIKPTRYDAGPGSETISIDVTAGAGCGWSTSTDATWITVAAGSTGSGNGTVRLTIAANTGGERTAVVTIAGQPLTLHQDSACSYSIKPTSYHTKRGRDDVDVTVTTDAECAWTASSSVDWVTVAEGASGTGKGKVHLRIAPNDGPARSAVLSIAGQPFEVTQDGRQ